MDNKKQKKQGYKDSKRSLGYPLAQSISLDKKDTVSYEMIPGKTTMENIGTKADGTPNMVPSISYSKRVISNKDYANRMGDRVDRFKSPAKNINQQIDPATGQVMRTQPITNRAGVPSRSINDLQGINTIQDPGMQSSQQADAFQKFNNIAQYNPPPAMKYGSPAKNYTKPAMIIDKSAGGLAEAGKAVEGSVQNKISQDSASDNEELINFLMNQK